MSKKIIPSLTSQIAAAQEAINNFVTQEPRISQVSSWYVVYDCRIDCSEEISESLRVNVTFDNHSYGTYISKTHPLSQALNDMERYYAEWVKEDGKKQELKKKEKRDAEILKLIQAGKISEAAALSQSCPVS